MIENKSKLKKKEKSPSRVEMWKQGKFNKDS